VQVRIPINCPDRGFAIKSSIAQAGDNAVDTVGNTLEGGILGRLTDKHLGYATTNRT